MSIHDVRDTCIAVLDYCTGKKNKQTRLGYCTYVALLAGYFKAGTLLHLAGTVCIGPYTKMLCR